MDVTRGKPDPQVFLIAAQRMGVEPAQCAVVEDAPAGVAARPLPKRPTGDARDRPDWFA